MLLIRTSAGLVGIFTGATDRREPTIYQANKLTYADLGRRLGKRIPTELPSMSLNETCFSKLLQNPLNEFQGEAVRLSKLRSRDNTASNFGCDTEMDGGTQGVFSFF